MRQKNIEYCAPIPEFVALKLTNRCNLRCKHCYQWNEDGYHNFMSKAEQNTDMEISIIEHVLEQTKQVKSRLYLWGGEPLVHKEISDIIKLLINDLREVSICTNGILIDKYLDDLIQIPNVEFLIAIEGFKDEHDNLRGMGSFEKVIYNVRQLLDLRRKGAFSGKITIHTMINDNLVPHLYDLLLFLEELGVDMIMICYPWYISDETSRQMDDYFKKNFSWLNKLDSSYRANWHAFKYRLSNESIPGLFQQLKKINGRVWKVRLRYQPDLLESELKDFIEGKDKTRNCSQQCIGLSTRMDIGPDGSVTACKLFSEFYMGNLHDKALADIWNSESYKKVRRIINKQLMPVCTKCNVLYLHGN